MATRLYPDASLAEGLAADLSATSHFLIRLRILHPTFAVLTAIGLLFGAPRLAGNRDAVTARLGRIVAGIATVQLALGALNVILLAPVWMQMIHLLVADLLWIAFVLLGASVLAVEADARVRAGVRVTRAVENLRLPG